MTITPLAIQSLTKAFGALHAVNEVSLTIERGEVFGYLGPNGAGKTTTIRCVMGFLKATRGQINLFGDRVQHGRATQHTRLGYLSGEFRIWHGMRPRRSLSVLASLGPKNSTVSRRGELAERLRLDLNRPYAHLSKGNRQKVGVISAFQHEPDLLILDEPTSGLDPLMRRVVLDLIREAAQAGAAVLLSSHDLSEVAAVAQRVAILREGRLVQTSPLADLLRQETHLIKVWFEPDQGPAPSDRPPPGIEIVERLPGIWCFGYRGSPDLLVKWLAQFGVERLTSPEPSLEEAFLQHYQNRTDTSPPALQT